MYNKIGFLTGIGGNAQGMGNLVTASEVACVPAVIGSNDDIQGMANVLNISNPCGDHQLLYRVVKEGGEGWAVPNYDLSPKAAALEYYNRVEPHIHFRVKENKDRVWIAVGNELDKNKCDWLGRWGIESANIWNANGYKVAMFGFASGTPEPEGWGEEGMVEFLKFAAVMKDLVAVNLHEYSYNNDLLHIFPWLIGRFQFLYRLCDAMGIDRPTTWIGEWGWHNDDVPGVSAGMPQLMDVANLYAQFNTIKGAAFWTLQTWNSELYNKVNQYINPVTEFSVNYEFAEFSKQDDVFVEPDYGTEEERMTFGIDVSRYQGTINWDTAKAEGVKFAFMKLTEGTATQNTIKDPQFNRNWSESKAKGIYRGAYHFYNAWLDPVQQADWFCDNLPEDWDFPPVADIEDRRGASATENIDILKFLERIEQRIGVKPIVYTSPGYWNSIVGNHSWASNYDLWVAHWQVVNPQLPLGWNTWAFWQYDVIYGGQRYGVQSERLDVDLFNGTEADLKAYVDSYHQPEPPEPPSDDCFDIPPFTRTFILRPQNMFLEQAGWVSNAMAVGVDVDGSLRTVGVEGWSVVDAFKDILDAVATGKTDSRLLILDGDQIGGGLTPEWMAANCPKLLQYTRWYKSDPVVEPPIPPEPPTPGKIDLKGYIIGDGRRYYLKNHDGSTQELLQSQLDSTRYYQVKNTAWESFVIDSNWIKRDKDVSAGGGRYYTQREGNEPARWLPRNMSVGEQFSVNLYVQFYLLGNCEKSSPNSGDVTDTRRLVGYYSHWKSRHGIELQDVVEIEWVNGGEKYFYAKGYGLVQWERTHQDPNTPAWTAISEIADEGRNDRMSGCYG